MTRRSRGSRGPRQPAGKIVSRAQVKAASARAHRRGQRVVFTNGVFDLMHAGHLKTIWGARALGDLLVVGINSDASVRRLKGRQRPFLSHRLRALMLAGLEAIDYVVIFTEDTPQRLIEAVQPDVLVKGGDWKGMLIVGRDVVEARGGRVVSVPLKRGLSTTRIAATIVSRSGRKSRRR
jgi:D-beta-D-heptose 7-phosphate kinase/D-beta-D-heptose 1-phosphate adenosyltransferase